MLVIVFEDKLSNLQTILQHVAAKFGNVTLLKSAVKEQNH